MFSRSEKTEEAFDPTATESSGERSPMVLAALAGLLALAGAFLLVWYLSNGDDAEVAQVDPNDPNAAVVNADGTVVTAASKQVLIVTSTIPRDTSVADLVASPTVWLSARAVPEEFVAAAAISSVAELQELDGLVTAADILPGEQLLRSRFRDPADFDATNETFRESQGIDTPEGHHLFAFDLPAVRALGGDIRPGELLTIIANFRLQPTGGGAGRDVSLVVLNSVELVQIDSNILPLPGQTAAETQVGAANQGTYRISVALLPEELTDLAYAVQYGQIMLATALPNLDNDEDPRAITTMRQLTGDDGVWLNELDDGNVVDLTELFPEEGSAAEGLSIELEAYAALDGPEDGQGDLVAEGEENSAAAGEEDEPGDS